MLGLRKCFNVPKRAYSKINKGSQVLRHFSQASDDKKVIHLNFKNKDGEVSRVPASVGRSILQVAHAHEIPLEGACESSLACSTCHVILQDSVFDSLPEASEEEDDMLDMAFGLTQTSRLGCQVFVTPEMDEAVVTLPAATRNFYIDGHVPQPH